jgi:hypothetical protein
MQVDVRLPVSQRYGDIVIHRLLQTSGSLSVVTALFIFFYLGGECWANVFTLYSKKHYFRSRNRALPQDSHSLLGSTGDLWTVLDM